MDSEKTRLGEVTPLHAGDPAQERLAWRRFLDAESPEEFYTTWLAIQCQSVDKVEAGLLLTRNRRTGEFTPAASWPASRSPGSHVRTAAERVIQEGRALALELEPQHDASTSGRLRTVVARPVEVAGELHAVVVLDVAPRPPQELERALRQLAWGSAWLELQALGTGGRSGDGLAALLEIISTPLEHERFKAAASAFVTELATRFGCERVSLGRVEHGRARLLVLSHSAEFDKRSNVARLIEAAMEEVVDRGSELAWPPADGEAGRLIQAHEALSAESGAVAICSFPIVRGTDYRGVVTLERNAGERFAESDLEVIDAAMALAGPILDIHRREDRPLAAKALDSARATLDRLVGPRHVAFKLTVGIVALLVGILAVAPGDFRVAADATLEARVLRAAVAPFDGYLLEAPARAGDLVEEGDLLALLDGRDLALERARFASQLLQLQKQYRQALADRDAPESRIVAARIDQVSAQHDLAADQLSRTRIEAPFAGIVVHGDLSQKLGSPVQRGELLFEVAPLDDYRPALEVDERNIDEIAVGQTGQIVFAAFPDEPLAFRVEKITAVSTASEGRNHFRVEGSLAEAPPRLRPGMEGVAKVDIGSRRLLWIWTHEPMDWLRLKLWSWLP